MLCLGICVIIFFREMFRSHRTNANTEVLLSGVHHVLELREYLVTCVCRRHDNALRTWLGLHRTNISSSRGFRVTLMLCLDPCVMNISREGPRYESTMQ